MDKEYNVFWAQRTKRIISCPECGKQTVIVAPLRGTSVPVTFSCMGYDGCDLVWSQPIDSLFSPAIEANIRTSPAHVSTSDDELSFAARTRHDPVR
jgi:hypothetical protein